MLPSYLSVLKILNQSNFKRSRNKGSIEFLLNSLYKQVVSDQCLMKTCKDSVPEHIKDSYRLCVHFAVIIYTLYEKLFETYSMKTPERWRALPRHALLVSILTQKLSKDVKTVQPWERWQTNRHTHTGPILYPRPLTREGKIAMA